MQHNQAMHRTHKLVVGVAPTHQFGDGQFFQRLSCDVGQIDIQGLPFFFYACDEIFGLVVIISL